MKKRVALAVSVAAWPLPLHAVDDSAHTLLKDAFTGSLPPVLSAMESMDTLDPVPMPDCGDFRLQEATIKDIGKAMANESLTSEQITECYMKRILQTQDYMNSVIQLNPDAMSDARRLDEERREGTVRGPLHGIPCLVKDNIATLDKMETTAGSFALLGSRPPRDAYVVKKLRDAGAVLLGKAAMSEWADMRSSNYSEGYSARGGQCRSAYNFTVNPGGSSSGSGVAVGANIIAFSLGTETDGSVINPAMRNSIVGFKPTVGLTSRAGVIPESEHQDSVGTFGRTVSDAVLVLDAIWGKDPNDNYTSNIQVPWEEPNHKSSATSFADYLSTKDALQNATFGLPWKSFWVYTDQETLRALEYILDLIKSAGATIINETEITNYERLVSPNGWDWNHGGTLGRPNESEYTYVNVDFYNNINKYLSELSNTNIKTLDDIVQYNRNNSGSEGGYAWPNGHPAFYSGQDGLENSLATGGKMDEVYYQALNYCVTSTRRGIDDALKQPNFNLNGLLVPVEPGQSYQIAAQAGYPVVTIPAGIHDSSGMGIGLGIMQSAWGEAELVKWASAIEHLQHHSGTIYKRQLPTWRGWRERPIPVPLLDFPGT